ncbi:MAG TPA: Gfo/Idh/MocA family oxidoreductase [Microbacteriaceae bacterium]
MTDGSNGIRIAVVGLGFGAEFVPIYRNHPSVASVTIADPRASVRDAVAEAYSIESVYDSLDSVLGGPEIDAVHVVTGLPDHAEHVIAALDAGKHVACTVPMALTFDDIQRIVDARERADKTYMMMETAVFTREFLFAQDLVRSGMMGEINYARGTHFQDMSDWPHYWLGLPPMFYATHALSPILSLLGARASSVRAMGGGALLPENSGAYENTFPVESALVQLEGRDTIVELTRSLFQLARPYTESFSIFGDRQGFEWPQMESSQQPLLYTLADRSVDRGRPIAIERITVPDRADLLPEPIRRYTQRIADKTHRSFVQGGGHGGSHPHMVHEFVSSIVEGRSPIVDHVAAANWTATGLAAHASALADGEAVTIPRF